VAEKAKNTETTANGMFCGMKALLLGLTLLAIGAFATVSIFGYCRTDPNLQMPEYSETQLVQNPCGVVGANVAYHLISTYGLAGYILPVLVFFWGFHIIIRKRLETPWRKLSGGLLLTTAAATFFGALSCGGGWLYQRMASFNIPVPYDGAPVAGGLLGYFGVSVLRAPFGPVGIYLIILGLVFLAAVLMAQHSFEWVLATVGNKTTGGIRNMFSNMRAVLASRAEQRAEIRKQRQELKAGKLAEKLARKTAASAGKMVVNQKQSSVEAAFGQSEQKQHKAPKVNIARIPDALPSAESDQEKNQSEEKELAALKARAAGKKAQVGKKPKAFKTGKTLVRSAGPRGASPRGPIAAGNNNRASVSGNVVDYSEYKLPVANMLEKVNHQVQVTNEVLTERGQVLVETLKEFRINTTLISIDRGPAVTIYELELAPGIKVQKVMELSDNLAMGMCAPNVRIIAPIPGRDSIGVEVPNTEREVVRMRPIMEDRKFLKKAEEMAVPFVIGRDASGEVLVHDLAKMPHMLVAGATGSGKSVCLNSFVATLLLTKSPADVKLMIVDPKMVEMSQYKGIPHLITPVITDMKRAAGVFDWASGKMDDRYTMLSHCGCRDISRYNNMDPQLRIEKARKAEVDNPESYGEHLPYIVMIVDELADLMMLASKEIEKSIIRLAQKSRAVGIHIVLATQRPSVDVVTGLIKTNMPARISFQVASKIDSRTILDQNGAEKLIGKGDMLFLPPTTSTLVRAKGAYISDNEVEKIVEHVKSQAKPDFVVELDNITMSNSSSGGAGGGLADDLFEEAVKVVLETRRGSVSLLQRRLGVGYTRAAKLVDMMAERSILGPYRGSKPRELLISLEEYMAGGLTNGPVAGQMDDERDPQGIPTPEDYNQAEESAEYQEEDAELVDDDTEVEPETASSLSTRE
jgi:DNA segregation ATPase FtsK/SpoIIIE, S-DNA-T family